MKAIEHLAICFSRFFFATVKPACRERKIGVTRRVIHFWHSGWAHEYGAEKCAAIIMGLNRIIIVTQSKLRQSKVYWRTAKFDHAATSLACLFNLAVAQIGGNQHRVIACKDRVTLNRRLYIRKRLAGFAKIEQARTKARCNIGAARVAGIGFKRIVQRSCGIERRPFVDA